MAYEKQLVEQALNEGNGVFRLEPLGFHVHSVSQAGGLSYIQTIITHMAQIAVGSMNGGLPRRPRQTTDL